MLSIIVYVTEFRYDMGIVKAAGIDFVVREVGEKML